VRWHFQRLTDTHLHLSRDGLEAAEDRIEAGQSALVLVGRDRGRRLDGRDRRSFGRKLCPAAHVH
jgi:hypothetical protein